jgi:choline-sulfatase
MPKLYAREQRPQHPYILNYGQNFNYDDYFEGPEDVKKALSGYFGLVSYLDENIGKLLGALNDSGQADDTLVMYTSDHGDNLGARGLWGKSTMYEENRRRAFHHGRAGRAGGQAFLSRLR